MLFHNYIINLLEEPMATEMGNPKYKALVAQTLKQHPQEILSNSKRYLETLVRLYYLRHGFEAMDSFMIQFLSLLAFMAQSTIESGTQGVLLQTLRSTIVLAATGLRDQSHFYYFSRIVFSAVRGGMGPEELDLINRFTEQGRAAESQPPKNWEAQSTWLIDFGSISDDVENRRLANLIEKTSEVSLSPTSPEDSE